MTTKQKQSRKQTIKEKAAALAEQRKEQAEMKEAEALEAAGKWGEAAIAWGVVADYAGGKARKSAAGRQAAAKVRASAVAQSIEAQMDAQMEADAAAKRERAEADRQDRERRVIEEEQIDEEETRAATPEEMAAEAAKQNKEPKAKKERTPKEPPAPRARDPRLPAIGTILIKRDRTGTERCRCTIALAGVEYADQTYRTISAAAMAAAKDLGLESKSQDGYAFWGLKKAAPKPVSAEVVAEARAAYTDAVARYYRIINEENASQGKIPAADAITAETIAGTEWLVTELRAIAAGLSAAKKLAK